MKKLVALLLVIFIIFGLSVNNTVYAESDNNNLTKREQEAKDEAYKQLDIFRDTLSPDNDFYYANFENLVISDPFIIYIANQDAQDEIYYFPVYDKTTNKTIYVIDVFSVASRDDFICEFSLAYNNVIDQCSYIDNPKNVIVYRIGYSVYFETNSTVYNDGGFPAVMNDSYSEKEYSFINKSFEDKRSLVRERVNSMAPHVSQELTDEEKVNALMNGVLTLYHPQYQYGYGMCWACAVATTCNYINSTTITGFNVCDAMNIGYNAGGSIINEKDALNYYGISYNCMRYAYTSGGSLSPISYSCITNNIDSYYPVILNGSSNSGNHAVTIRGYNGSGGASYNIMYFDSSYNNIYAAQKNCTYNNQYFESQGVLYDFLSTLSKYW
ncbi:hypothetical protein SAMN04487934_11018 [Eubacterium ruminantium]|nr:hypothetical protein SAMN04487934_11018 [Eubacterium ruminantium]